MSLLISFTFISPSINNANNASVQVSHSVFSHSVIHELQHARLPCPSPTSGACSNSCSIYLVMPSNHLILCHPLLFLHSVFPSIRVFSNELALRIRWAKYWSFSISPSNEYLGLISFRICWFDLLAVQGTLNSLLQHHNLKTSVLQCSVFFMVQTLTSVHDYWKNSSFDYSDLCWQSDVSSV